MTEFADLLRRFTVKTTRLATDVFVNSGSACLDSIQNGSEVTGSPGQPVGQYGPGYHPGKVGGELKASWQLEFVSPTEILVATNNQDYAVQNEYGVSATGGPYLQRSTVGGRHSVALTVAGFEKLVEAEAVKAAGGQP